MAIQKHADKPGENLVLGLWMALGVTAFWVALGLPVAFVAGVADPSRLFGIWWLTLGIGLLIGFMGIGIMGMFTIQLPNAVYAINPKADTRLGVLSVRRDDGRSGAPLFRFCGGRLAGRSGDDAVRRDPDDLHIAGDRHGGPVPRCSPPNRRCWHSIPKSGPAGELVKQVMGLMLLGGGGLFRRGRNDCPGQRDAVHVPAATLVGRGGLCLAGRSVARLSAPSKSLLTSARGLPSC
jgi:hypothetical protein